MLSGWRTQPKSHPPVAAEGQIHGQGEDVLHELLVDLEEAAKLLVRDAEPQQDADGHAERELLRLMVHVDGLGVAAPGPEGVLDHQLDLGQITLQSLMAENLGENLQKTTRERFLHSPNTPGLLQGHHVSYTVTIPNSSSGITNS